ncbi:MAG: c-type cytochrome [Gemmobacter sp.]|nr:c-type cytochrome [Gemmobacter sp.]
MRALASGQGLVISGSFDTRAIVWDAGKARQVTRAHTGAVTAVVALSDGFASGGQDGQVVIWGRGTTPLDLDRLHDGPVAALALGPQGLASGGWDGRIVVRGAVPQSFDAHQGQVTGLVAWGDGLASVGSDLKLRLWQNGALAGVVGLTSPPTVLASDQTALFVAGADGVLRRIVPGQGSTPPVATERALSDRPLPVVALAVSKGVIAAASISGEVWILDADTLTLRTRFDTAQGAVWALTFDGESLLTGGQDGLIRRWSRMGDPLGADPTPGKADGYDDGSRGAEVWRACAVCHSLTPDDASRAGPSLHGLFGRKIGTAPGYAYSEALRALDIIWTPDSLSDLFALGPDAYTPGSRMPEQRIPDAQDRAALAAFLANHR